MPEIGTDRKFGDNRKGVPGVSASCEIMTPPSTLKMGARVSLDWSLSGPDEIPMQRGEWDGRVCLGVTAELPGECNPKRLSAGIRAWGNPTVTIPDPLLGETGELPVTFSTKRAQRGG